MDFIIDPFINLIDFRIHNLNLSFFRLIHLQISKLSFLFKICIEFNNYIPCLLLIILFDILVDGRNKLINIKNPVFILITWNIGMYWNLKFILWIIHRYKLFIFFIIIINITIIIIIIIRITIIIINYYRILIYFNDS